MAETEDGFAALEAQIGALLGALAESARERDALEARIADLEREGAAAREALTVAGDRQQLLARLSAERTLVRERVQVLLSEVESLSAEDASEGGNGG